MKPIQIKTDKIKIYFTSFSILFIIMLILSLVSFLLSQFSIVHHDILIQIIILFIAMSLLLPFFLIFRRNFFLLLEDNQLIYGLKNIHNEFEDDAYIPLEKMKKIRLYKKLFYKEIVVYTEDQTISIDTLNYRQQDFEILEQWLHNKNFIIKCISTDTLFSPNQCLQCNSDITFKQLIQYIFKPNKYGFRCQKCNHQIFDLNIYIAIVFIVFVFSLWVTNKAFSFLNIDHNMITFALVYLSTTIFIGFYLLGYVWKYKVK